MFKFYNNLTGKKKIFFLFVTIILSVPLGALLGGMLGLVATTFIPMCCDNGNCYNCFEYNGMVGYEATGFLGFWTGLFLVPILYILFIAYLEIKK